MLLATLLIASVDTLLNVVIAWLVLRLIFGGGGMPLFRHEDEERDWRERRGRFAFVLPDRPGRPQVKPAEPPDVRDQTHTHRGGGAYHDGPAADDGGGDGAY